MPGPSASPHLCILSPQKPWHVSSVSIAPCRCLLLEALADLCLPLPAGPAGAERPVHQDHGARRALALPAAPGHGRGRAGDGPGVQPRGARERDAGTPAGAAGRGTTGLGLARAASCPSALSVPSLCPPSALALPYLCPSSDLLAHCARPAARLLPALAHPTCCLRPPLTPLPLQVERLAKLLKVAENVAYTCETAAHFWLLHVLSRWERFLAQAKAAGTPASVGDLFPFKAGHRPGRRPPRPLPLAWPEPSLFWPPACCRSTLRTRRSHCLQRAATRRTWRRLRWAPGTPRPPQ